MLIACAEHLWIAGGSWRSCSYSSLSTHPRPSVDRGGSIARFGCTVCVCVCVCVCVHESTFQRVRCSYSHPPPRVMVLSEWASITWISATHSFCSAAEFWSVTHPGGEFTRWWIAWSKRIVGVGQRATGSHDSQCGWVGGSEVALLPLAGGKTCAA